MNHPTRVSDEIVNRILVNKPNISNSAESSGSRCYPPVWQLQAGCPGSPASETLHHAPDLSRVSRMGVRMDGDTSGLGACMATANPDATEVIGNASFLHTAQRGERLPATPHHNSPQALSPLRGLSSCSALTHCPVSLLWSMHRGQKVELRSPRPFR